MFLGSTKPELEDGFLRSGRRFRSGKRRKTLGGRHNPIFFKKESMKWIHG